MPADATPGCFHGPTPSVLSILDNSLGQPEGTILRTPLQRGNARPAAECAGEGAGVGVAQRVRDVDDRLPGFSQEVARDLEADLVEHGLERPALSIEPTVERPPVHVQLLREPVSARRSGEQQEPKRAKQLR